MKKIIMKEVTFCDKCKEEDSYPDTCLCCGTQMCSTCAEKHGIEYPHSVYCSGSGDGFYCKPCDAKLTASGTDMLHKAYQVIQSLRSELEDWSRAFKQRAKAAETLVKTLAK